MRPKICRWHARPHRAVADRVGRARAPSRGPAHGGTSRVRSRRTGRSVASGPSAAARLSRDHRPARARVCRRSRQRPERHGPAAGSPRADSTRPTGPSALARASDVARSRSSLGAADQAAASRKGRDDSAPLLRAQLELLERGEHALAARVGEVEGFDRTVAVWRLSTARAARSFVEALLDERGGEPVNYEAIGHVSSVHASLNGMPLQPAADD